MKFTKSKVTDCQTIELPKIHNRAGNITAINEIVDVPFKIKRVYYLYDVPGGEERGGHAHKNLYQIVIAASGSFDILLDDGRNKKTISLNRPYKGLIIVPGIWREVINFSSGSICLVLASEIYTAGDYIRDYNVFKGLKNES
jgi:hypothetical protein